MPIRLKPSLNWLLVFVPAAFLLRYVPGWRSDVGLFVCACVAIIPMAGLMGRATEELAEKMGQGIGGLLNATFGNAAELIIALIALQKGLTGVVKASLTGSIIGNVLLVFGAAALAGGLRYPTQRFNRVAAQSATSSLMLAAIALLIPSVFHFTAAARPGGWSPDTEQRLSLAIAVVLFLTYACSLVFSLVTHKQLFRAGEAKADSGKSSHQGWSRGKALLVLLLATVLVAALSEFLVSSVEAAQSKLGVTEVFLGIIVVAIIGNAAEHSTAILVARKDKMDLSLGIAAGSSLQVALLLAPVLVFCSYLFGQPMNLEFTIPEVVAVIAAVVILAEISNDGETNWFEGVQLLSVYLILAILFYFLPSGPGS
jgi:Ca2+:H+ antiporter